MKKTNVYTYGVFDMLHWGHVNIINKASEYGDNLYVGIVKDEAVKKQKGNDRPIIPCAQREYLVNNLRNVTDTLEQDTFNPIEIIESLWSEGIKINILVLGEDQNHLSYEDKKHLMQKFKICIETLPRTIGVSTSDIVKKMRVKK